MGHLCCSMTLTLWLSNLEITIRDPGLGTIIPAVAEREGGSKIIRLRGPCPNPPFSLALSRSLMPSQSLWQGSCHLIERTGCSQGLPHTGACKGQFLSIHIEIHNKKNNYIVSMF